ncbi:MAG: FAD-dependent monooxygenase [Alphaproteobacteria bacterium]|nr:FAD-dependent monooxygenase [Alphaproteobacteria bacterium SS10]
MPDTQPDLLVAGGGAAGLVTALAACQAGWSVTLVDPGPLTAKRTNVKSDARTTAIMASGIRMLEQLGVWQELEPISAPLRYLQLIDDSTGNTLDQRFDAAEIDQEWFAQNVPNEALKSTLMAVLKKQNGITLLPGTTVHGISHRDQHLQVRIGPDEGPQDTIEPKLLVAADGRRSACRDMLRIGVVKGAATEMALVFNTEHAVSHDGISYEFHGPLADGFGQVTTIPLPGNRSAINLVGDEASMNWIGAMEEPALRTLVEDATRGRLGKIMQAGKPSGFPVRPFRAQRLSASRAVLVGEAAHALAPIGAQGLNTTLADIAVLIDLLGPSGRADPGRPDVTDGYRRARRFDVIGRSGAISLLSDMVHRRNPVVDQLRRLGLRGIGAVGPLRRQLMSQGMKPLGQLPRLMRPISQP